jgi:hypothetical protein
VLDFDEWIIGFASRVALLRHRWELILYGW